MVTYKNDLGPASNPDVSLSLDENVRAKEGGKETMGETALRLPSVPFPWSLAVHHQSLASTLRKNEAPEEEADLGLCCNQMLDACWQRFEPRNIDFKKFLFQLRHVSKVHSNN